MNYYIIILLANLIVAVIFAAIITNSGSNYKLGNSFGYYVLLSFFFTPIIALLFAILDALTKNTAGVAKASNEKENKPVKPQGNKVWIANDADKRITVFESELPDYLKNGWHTID